MKLLLDTCAILWLTEPRRLSLAARTAIRNNPLELFASAISAFEIGLKHRKGRIDLGMDVHVWWPRIVDHHGLSVAPVSSEVALGSSALPMLHADPCDRMIIATAVTLDMTIITCDRMIRQYPQTQVIW